jgi:hypothetical protein
MVNEEVASSEDLAAGTRRLRELRREVLQAVGEHGPNSEHAWTLQALLESESVSLIPPPGSSAAIMAYLQQLRSDLMQIRSERPGSGTALDAWNLYFNESERLGYSLTALEEYSPDEEVRFFSRVVWGIDGHAYWTGPRVFAMNGGRSRMPRRWWWERENQTQLKNQVRIWPTCGQAHCIAPTHNVAGAPGPGRRWTDTELIGKLQAYALKHGRSPSRKDWAKAGFEPTTGGFLYYFGSWNKALVSAGLELNRNDYTAEDCLKAIRFARQKLGHWPSHDEFIGLSRELNSRGLPGSMHSIRRNHGSWMNAKEKARHGDGSFAGRANLPGRDG